MPAQSAMTPLFVLAGLLGGHAMAEAPPAAAVAEMQLRAINHRFIDAAGDASGSLGEALTHADFVLTEHDGQWRGRAEFLAALRVQPPRPKASIESMQSRLFGPVAVVHGVFHHGDADAAGGRSRQRFTDVHLWNGSRWQLVSVQNTWLADGVPTALQTGTAPSGPAWAGNDPSGDEQHVLHTLNEQYVNAFREADVAWYDAHLSADYVVVSGDGSMRDRAAALENFAKPTFAQHMKHFPVGKVTVRRFGELALIHAENDYELKDGRKGVSRYLDIWHHHDGRWRCVAAHITVLKAPTL
jgi:ketosteroid isomerase-like protein